MVRFVRDQPDAYIYSSFGTRIFIAGLLLALLYVGQGILAGIAILFVALILDRVVQGKKRV